jgi:TPR repeat protein
MQYQEGNGVRQNYTETAKWFAMAAERGHSRAQFNLGMAYYEGLGVPQDYIEAAMWIQKAAEQGVLEAQGALADLYYLGEGVPPDYVEAYAWADVAAARGNKAAKQVRDRVASRLTPNQLEAAENLSSERLEQYVK